MQMKLGMTQYISNIQKLTQTQYILGVQAAFVSTAAGALLSPKQLFDPRNGELAELLDGASSFPSPVFSSDEQVKAVQSDKPPRPAEQVLTHAQAAVLVCQMLDRCCTNLLQQCQPTE
jgi:hypothetical protein